MYARMFTPARLFFAAVLFAVCPIVHAQHHGRMSDVLVLPVNSSVPPDATKITSVSYAATPAEGYEHAIWRLKYKARRRRGNVLVVREVKYPVSGRDVIAVTADVYKADNVASMIRERTDRVDSILNSKVEPGAQHASLFIVWSGAAADDTKLLTLHIGDTTVCKIALGQSYEKQVPAGAPLKLFVEHGTGERLVVTPQKGKVTLLNCYVTPSYPFGMIRGVRPVENYYGAEELLRQPVNNEVREVVEPVYTSRLHFAPFRPFVPIFPGWEIGYERMMGPRYSVRVFGSLLNDNMTNTYFSYQGGRLGLECKRFTGFGGGLQVYLSVEAVASDMAFSNAYEFADTGVQSIRDPYSDTISVTNRSFALNIKTGVQQRFGRFIIDVYAGIGVQHKLLEHSGRLYSEDLLYSRHPNATNATVSEKNGLTISLPLNMSVAYCFGRKTRHSK